MKIPFRIVRRRSPGSCPRGLLLVVAMLLSLTAGPVPAAPPAAGSRVEEDKPEKKKDEGEKKKGDTDEETKGHLDRIDEDVSKDRPSGRHGHHAGEDDEDSLAGSIASIFAEVGLQLMLGLPDSTYGSRESFARPHFSSYPYAHAGEGLYSMRSGRHFAARAGGGWFRHSDDLGGLVLNAQVSPHPLVGGEFRFARFREDLPDRRTDLDIWNLFVNYYRVRGETWAMWWGLGVTGVRGAATHAGLGFDVAADVYPSRPVSLLLRFNASSVNGNAVTEFQAGVRAHAGPLAPYAGYQSWSTSRTTLRGPTVGLEVYFY